LLPIAREGWAFILPPLAVAGILAAGGFLAVAALALVVAAFMTYFFRDPERRPPANPAAIVAPADGRVVDVRPRVDDPFVGPAQQVSIFLSPLDVHVNRSPLSAQVVSVEHTPGAFLAAYRPEASERNERTPLALQGEAGRVVVRQIAGVLARRIVCRVRAGDRLGAGQRFGMIRFGSRTDLVVPVSARLSIRSGDRVRAGETVMATLG
jgi:phosphatidylserine decarboxylase